MVEIKPKKVIKLVLTENIYKLFLTSTEKAPHHFRRTWTRCTLNYNYCS